MTPERWEKVKDVLATALELAPPERSNYLDRSCAGDSELRREVELLLAREQSANSRFLGATSLARTAAAVMEEEQNPWIERRVGAYRIIEQIGVGGMGEVYCATRADDQYRKEVALKVVRTGLDSGIVITRFKHERQILASLEHPNIARLLDGGSTPEGTPYLVMDLIEGRPIVEYCDANQLSIPERLELFLQVCGAVQYAHQRLIIHRDIKPGNILVTSSGTPKLLDFGIAKVFDSDEQVQRDETFTAFRALTPEYASPEQISGEPVTTASDVYSLGVVLFALLTGSTPYPITRNARELASMICEREPDQPSAVVARPSAKNGGDRVCVEQIAAVRGSTPHKLHKQLQGDLDNIVLMALRKEPSRRYASAEQFAADIRRHLDSLPVVARKDTASYRVSKFVRRHQFGVLATAMVALAIMAGLAVAVHEARLAREQAEIARMQRGRAEHRFNDVRKLANSLMFEIHDSIRDLPGATDARKLLVSRAVEYLDSLSQEASGDVSLQRELAAAYDRVGDLLGYSGAANMGDFPGALQSYNKALAIREVLAAANPADMTIQSELCNEYFRLSFVLLDAGDATGALNSLRKELPIAQKLAATQAEAKYQDILAGFYWRTGSIQNTIADYTHAAESFRKAASIREPYALAANANPWFRTHLAADYVGLANALGSMGQTNLALEPSRKGVQLLEQVSGSDPTNATLREYLAEAYFVRASLLETRSPDQAVESFRNAKRIYADLGKRDPANEQAKVNFACGALGIAQQLLRKHEIDAAIAELRQSIATLDGIEVKNGYVLGNRADSYGTLGVAYEALAEGDASNAKKAEHLRAARTWLEKSDATWQEDLRRGSADPIGRHKSDITRRELAKCTAALAKLQ